MRALAAGTDISTNVADNLIASCGDAASSLSNNRYMVGDAGNYYSDNGTAITKQKTAGSGTYTSGITDMVPFAGSFFTTTTTDITKWNGTSTLDEHYWTTTKSKSALVSGSGQWHPLLIYQSFMWIGDGNLMHNLDTSETANSAVLTLNTNEIICALGVDPLTGLMMISVSTSADNSDVVPSTKIVYLWDGISSKPIRKILVDDLVTAFFNLEGTVYVGAGQTLGQWNGNGVTFLRKFQNVTLLNTDLAYKHHFTNTRNILHVVDGQKLLSYGAVISGKKGFFYTATPLTGSNHLSIVYPRGSNRVAIAYATTTVVSFDFSSTASSGVGGVMYFNNTYMPRPTFIRRMRIITTGITTTGGIGGQAIFDEKNGFYQTATTNFKVIAAASPKYVFDFDYTNLKLQGLQPRITMDTQGFGIVRVIIYYDIAE